MPKISLNDSPWLMMRPSAGLPGTLGVATGSRSGIWARKRPLILAQARSGAMGGDMRRRFSAARFWIAEPFLAFPWTSE